MDKESNSISLNPKEVDDALRDYLSTKEVGDTYDLRIRGTITANESDLFTAGVDEVIIEEWPNGEKPEEDQGDSESPVALVLGGSGEDDVS